MLSEKNNELICRVGANTPMGNALRRYWIPVMQSSDLPEPDCDPFPLEMLGDHFVAFRNSSGAVGILDELCAHRRASLVIGRCEGNGIRCIYHGWKFAVDGSVMETPNVADPNFKTRIKTMAYPVREAGGLIWAYFGPKEHEPEFPHFNWFDTPESHRLNAYSVNNTNYVQVFEALVDSSHLNILHADGLNKSAKLENLNFAAAADLAFDATPNIEVDDTDFGYHYAAIRGGTKPGEDAHVRVTAVMAPFMVLNPNEDLCSFVVPVNDYRCIHFRVWHHPERKMGEEPLRSSQLQHVGLDEESKRAYCMTWDTIEDAPRLLRRHNHYGQDRKSMREGSFSGLHAFNQEDAAVSLSSGALKDRSREMLAPVDAAVSRYHRMLINIAQSADAGKDPLGLRADPTQIVGRNASVAYGTDWRTLVPTHNVTQRHRSPRTSKADETLSQA